MASFEEVMAQVRKRMEVEATPELLGDINAVFLFEVTGDEPAFVHAKVANGKAEVVEAAYDNPNVTIIISLDDLAKLVAGELNATSAFMAGKVKIKGDMPLALKMSALIG